MAKRTIPEIRARMIAISEQLAEPLKSELRQLAYETIRRSPARRKAPTRHPPLTEETKEQIRLYAFNNPDKHLQDIAEEFDTNSGRVSEALHYD